MTTKYEVVVEKPQQQHYTLFVHNLRVKEDAGEYMVRAENELGVTVCKTVLNVERVVPVNGPRFIRSLPERTLVHPNQPTTLECEIAADETVSFQWFVNGIEIPRTSPEYVIEEDRKRNHSLLKINLVKPELVQRDVCVQATAPDGISLISRSILEMQIAPQEQTPQELITSTTLKKPETFTAEFSRYLDDHMEVFENQRVVLECETQPTRTPTDFKWYVNGLEVTTEMARDIQIQKEQFYSSLEIQCAKPQHTGAVTVEVLYLEGQKLTSTCELQVVPEPQVVEVTIQPKPVEKEPLKCVQVAPETTPLRLIQPLYPQVVPKIGENVVLIAAFESVPPAAIDWTVSNPETAKKCEIVPLIDQTKPRYSISQLTIHDFNPVVDDAVKVQAVGRTSTEQIATTCEIQASVPEERFTAHFTKMLQPVMQVVEAHRVVVDVEVQQHPGPVDFTWYVNGIQVSKPTFHEIVVENEPHRSTLQIERIELKHAGTITLEATYPQGQKLMSTCELQVIPQPSVAEVTIGPTTIKQQIEKPQETVVHVPLRFIQPLQPYAIPTAGEDLVLIAAVEAVPAAKLTWTISQPETASCCEIMPIVDASQPTYTISQLTIHQFNPVRDRGVLVQAIARTPTEELVSECRLEAKEIPVPAETAVLTFLKPLQPALTPNEDNVLQ